MENATLNTTEFAPISSTGFFEDEDSCVQLENGCQILNIVRDVCESINLFLSVITFIIAIILRKYRKFGERIYLHLVISNMAHSITDISGRGTLQDGVMCRLQGFFLQYLGVTMFTWVTSLTLYLLLVVRFRKKSNIRERTHVALCWGLPALLAAIPLFTGSYGPSGMYCWMDGSKVGSLWRFALYWIPNLAATFTTLVVFIYLNRYIWRERRKYMNQRDKLDKMNKSVSDYLQPFQYYAIAFFVMNIPRVSNRVHDLLADEPLLWLYCLHVACSAGYGITLSLLFYILNDKTQFAPKELLNQIKTFKFYNLTTPVAVMDNGKEVTDTQNIVVGAVTPCSTLDRKQAVHFNSVSVDSGMVMAERSTEGSDNSKQNSEDSMDLQSD